MPVRHSGGVYAADPVHVNGAESKNWHLRAFLFSKRSVLPEHTPFYAFQHLPSQDFMLIQHYMYATSY